MSSAAGTTMLFLLGALVAVCLVAGVSGEMPKGSLHGHLTLAELQAWLKREVLPFKSFTQLSEIGRSYEGRPLEVLCVGELCHPAPSTTYSGDALYTGLHHAREPLGMMALVAFLDDILTKYKEVDPTTRHLVKRRRLYFFFVVNPDGYIANERGDGMRRKNLSKGENPACPLNSQAPDFTSELGVDLNRNYDFCFSEDDVGSSSNACAIDYRGPHPFSEPETQAMKKFMETRTFKVAFNYHSFGRKVYIPYSCKAKGAPQDDGFFNAYAKRLTRKNNYEYGQPWAKGLYSVNGDAADWMFSVHGVYAVSPEVAPQDPVKNEHDGFWLADASRVAALAKETLDMNYVGAYTAGFYPDVAFDFDTLKGAVRNWGLVPQVGFLMVAVLEKGSTTADILMEGVVWSELGIKGKLSKEFTLSAMNKGATIAVRDDMDCAVFDIDFTMREVREHSRVAPRHPFCTAVFSKTPGQPIMPTEPPTRDYRLPNGGKDDLIKHAGGGGPTKDEKDWKQLLILIFLGIALVFVIAVGIVVYRRYSAPASAKTAKFQRVAASEDDAADEEDPLKGSSHQVEVEEDEVDSPPPKPPKRIFVEDPSNPNGAAGAVIESQDNANNEEDVVKATSLPEETKESTMTEEEEEYNDEEDAKFKDSMV